METIKIVGDILLVLLGASLVLGQYRLGKRISHNEELATNAAFDSQDALVKLEEISTVLLWHETRINALTEAKPAGRTTAARKAPAKKEAK